MKSTPSVRKVIQKLSAMLIETGHEIDVDLEITRDGNIAFLQFYRTFEGFRASSSLRISDTRMRPDYKDCDAYRRTIICEAGLPIDRMFDTHAIIGERFEALKEFSLDGRYSFGE